MKQYYEPWSSLIFPSQGLIALSLALIAPLPANRFPNKVAARVSINMPKNPTFYYFAAFLIVSLTPFIKKPDS